MPYRAFRPAAALLVCVLAGTGCTRSAPGEAVPPGLVGELAALGVDPAVSARLSISRARAALPGAERVAGVAARAAQRSRDAGDADAMHAAALIDLAYGGDPAKALQRSISALHASARVSARPAPVLADLAAAYVLRAERRQGTRDLLAAIDAADAALEREPRNAAALFNHALAMQRLGLVEETAAGWRAYLAVDSASGWAADARTGLRRVRSVQPLPAPPGPGASDSAYASYAAADPQGARELGWCRELGGWAVSALAGEREAADRHLRRAEALAAALERRPGGDRSLADQTRAIRGRPSAALARAHREYSAGCELRDRVEYRLALPRFAAATEAGTPALRAWARLQYATMLSRTGEAARAESIFRELAGAADTSRHPSLAANARLHLSSVLLRQDRYEPGMLEARRAADLFRRSGERESEGTTVFVLAIASFYLRDMDEGYALSHRALERLAPFRDSYRLHNLLSALAETASDDGFPRAGMRVQNEGVRVAVRTGKPVFAAEAHLLRARLRAATGDLAGARADVAAGDAAIATLGDPRAKEWMTARRQMAASQASLRTRPALAALALDSAAGHFLGMRTPLVALPAMVSGAQAWLAAGDARRAAARLESALAVLEQRRDSIRMEPRRAAVFETARALVDRLAMLHLASGQTAEALRYLDRGRASLASAGSGGDAGALPASPPGEVLVEYALIRDTLLAWTVAGREVKLHRAVVDTAQLFRMVEGAGRKLERAAGEAELRPELSALYDWLVRPIESRLGAASTRLVIVPDGILSAVPFAALYDARRRRYLVEDHPLRFAVSLREAGRQPRPADSGQPALFVADPAFDGREHPGFERLPAAAGEVAAVSAGYGRSRVLSGAGATPTALRAELGRAGMLHYAGHAVFDDERPERSFLLTAPDPEGASPPVLTASAIAQLDLRNLSLVVLAACETVRTGQGRAAGFSGLAGAFLAAGAGGVLGSVWEVDDDRTRTFMTEFHRSYRTTGDAASALAATQRRLLRSPDPALRSPAAWAVFRYAGNSPRTR